MSGFDVCDRIRKNPVTRNTTILHISASSVESHHQVTGLEHGADGYLVEPLDASVLIATVNAFVRAKQAEDGLRRSNMELEAFAYRIAHDLKEPLRGIRASLQIVELEVGSSTSSRLKSSMGFALDAASRMDTLIGGLLRFAEVTHDDSQSRTLSCEALLDGALLNLSASVRESGAIITRDPLPVVSAGGGLETVFQNLIGNALKYRRPDIVPEIHVSAKLGPSSWLFSVRDNGIGIEARHFEMIFQVFTRLHGREIRGNGLGLALCKKVVEAHGGSIWVESQVGQGSTFFFSIPHGTAAPASA